MVLCALGLGMWLLFPRLTKGQASKGGGEGNAGTKAEESNKKGGRAGAAGRPTPVAASPARMGDVNVYVTGLGTVTAYNTVTVRSRVDGELINVAFREGQMVRQGDLLAEIDPRPFQVQLTQAEGTMARDQATLANTRVDLQRYLTLVQQGAVTQQQADTQAAAVRQQEGVIKSDQGAIDAARLQLTYTHIQAPISGRIGLRGVDRGNIVHAADANGLATITQIQPIAILFSMPEDNLPAVQRRMRAIHNLTAEAWDRDLQNKLATGSLLTLDNVIDQTTGTVKVKLQFANRENTLFPNQFVNVRLLVDTRRGVTLIPTAAVQRGSQGTYVFVVKSDQTVDMRNVTTGPAEGEEISIASGLTPGEVVVTEGIDRLQPGAKVTTRAPNQRGGRQHSQSTGEDTEGTQYGNDQGGAKPAGTKPQAAGRQGAPAQGGSQGGNRQGETQQNGYGPGRKQQ